MQSLQIRVFDIRPDSASRLLFESEISRPFRVGRQEPGEKDPISLIKSVSKNPLFESKLVIATPDERQYSRNFAEIVFQGDSVEIRNTSTNQPILVGASAPLNPQESLTVNIPTEITFGTRKVAIRLPPMMAADSSSMMSLDKAPSPPGAYATLMPAFSLAQASRDEMDSHRLLELLQTMLQIFQNPPNCQEFFDQAAKAMIGLLELDHVMIAFRLGEAPDFDASESLQTCGGGWKPQALVSARARDAEWSPSAAVLRMVNDSKKTIYHIPEVVSQSLVGIQSLVSSPLLNVKNEVIGVVYGDRDSKGGNQQVFSETEAMFVELFASAISTGMARLNQDQKLFEMRSRFDQFFTPALARQLESDPKMLEPRSAKVSLLFADIRGFSRISERIGPEKTIAWINSVMTQLSDCVFRHEGVVVDYIGDELIAMWGAPLDRENHAELAVRAAQDMIDRLSIINEQWEKILGEPVVLGIGINSGEAQVGNTGSDRKFKYGPLGDVVNVCSRLQGATKQLQAELLVTESTANLLPPDVLTRKIRSVRFVNVKRAFAVYEVPIHPDAVWIQLKKSYEKGLELYESRQFPLASQQMASIITKYPHDGPTLLLLSDSVNALANTRADFDPVWTLPQK